MKNKVTVLLLLFTLFSSQTFSQPVTANIIQRVFLLKINNNVGSSFTIEDKEKQFLITARHLLNGNISPKIIEIFRNGSWYKTNVTPIFSGNEKVDIVAFELPTRISPTHPLTPTSKGMFYGQDMYFLGFPYGLKVDDKGANNHFPFPFVKKGILSAFETDKDDNQIIYLDGHNNPGFSGGPIVFYDLDTKELKVAGVVSGYRNQFDKIYKNNGKKNPSLQNDTEYYTLSNSGILVGYRIDSIISAITDFRKMHK